MIVDEFAKYEFIARFLTMMLWGSERCGQPRLLPGGLKVGQQVCEGDTWLKGWF